MIEPKPSEIRKYIYEYCLLGLSASVIYLFVMYNSLQSFIREQLTEQIVNSSNQIQENNYLLKQLKQTKNETTNYQPSTFRIRNVRVFESCNTIKEKPFFNWEYFQRSKFTFKLPEQKQALQINRPKSVSFLYGCFGNGILQDNKKFRMRFKENSAGYFCGK